MALTPDLERQLARFKRLPQVEDIWEGGVVRLPIWEDGDATRDPQRPSAAMWFSAATRGVHMKPLAEAGELETAIAALCEVGVAPDHTGYRPTTIRARGSELADALTSALAGTGTEVVTVATLPAITAVLSNFAEDRGDPPGLLDGEDVTVERLRAFADAAKAFYEAAPWRHLMDDDLIRIEQPAEDAPTLCSVMGCNGGLTGLAFYVSEDQHRKARDGYPPPEIFEEGIGWTLFFSPAWEVPFVDLDDWERLDLPLASPRAYPMPILSDVAGGGERPDASRLAWFEGLLRVLAQTTEEEMDSGRWSRRAKTFDGEVEYALSLPYLLEPPDEEPGLPARRTMERMVAEIQRSLKDESFESLEDANAAIAERFVGRTIDELPSSASTPLERAQDLAYAAAEAGGRRQLQLIRQALAESPDCADAYALLAERTASLDEKRTLYEQAVEAGARALGPSAFTDPDVAFWGDVTTRPYMRARAALAEVLAAQGAEDEAIGHYRALLALNPGDNQGIRFLLLELLLDAGRDDEAAALFEEYDEPGALWTYAGVLLALRAKDQRLARRRLRAALRANRHVSRYLTGQRELPDILPGYYSPGKDDEAVLCAESLMDAWEATPGAVAWLRTEVRRR